MYASLKRIAARMGRILLSFLPWALALYLHYWLEQSGVWRVDMPGRSALSIVLLAVGMGLSFALHSRLSRSSAPRARRRPSRRRA